MLHCENVAVWKRNKEEQKRWLFNYSWGAQQQLSHSLTMAPWAGQAAAGCGGCPSSWQHSPARGGSAPSQKEKPQVTAGVQEGSVSIRPLYGGEAPGQAVFCWINILCLKEILVHWLHVLVGPFSKKHGFWKQRHFLLWQYALTVAYFSLL